MRVNRSGGRKISNRRAHRPDGRVYRLLRLRQSGRQRPNLVPWLVAGLAVVLATALLVWLLR
jgi:hypothetical protein